MLKHGFTMPYEFIGVKGLAPELLWGYMVIKIIDSTHIKAAHVELARWKLPPHKVYADLFNLVKDKGTLL